MSNPIIILDAGHGMGNRTAGVFDPGAVSAGVREADIALDYVNELRSILRERGARVIRTRRDHADPAPVAERANIARHYNGEIMLSFHCNAHNGTPRGTETFYRGLANKQEATTLNAAVCNALGTRNRGAKNESQSQHGSLAIMRFQPCFLIELGFIDNDSDRAAMLDPAKRRAACLAIADILLPHTS
jgi:N-acetylmuramoyl-L-alanine amidase